MTSRVRVVRDGVITTVIGGGTAPLGSGLETRLQAPQHVRWDAVNGRLLVADSGNRRVLAWDRDADIVTDLAPSCDLVDPRDATPDDGTVLVADGVRNVVIDVATCDPVVGSGSSGVVDARGARAETDVLYYPTAVHVDPAGDVYVSSALSYQVVRRNR